jgi:molybdopterin-guanine dinucleotide biosynthesis protein MobB
MISQRSHEQYYFHPNELAFCGHSGSGKTTLIEKICSLLSERSFKTGYLKHDAHSFSIDHPGKDTARVLDAGASAVVINDSDRSALVSRDSDPKSYTSIFMDMDLLLVEGYKDLQLPKIMMLDDRLSILERFPISEEHRQVAYVGHWKRAPLELNRPYFHRDDVDSLSYFITDYLSKRCLEKPLYGLVVAGGRSRRMGQDKALFHYHNGQTQLEYCYRILKDFCANAFISVRQDQALSGEYTRFNSITDSFLDLGPLGGILSAMRAYPNSAFVVLAIDMPAVDSKVLARLLESRNPFRFATAFQSHAGDFPEPLCTIYEPKSYGRILSDLPSGLSCPTSFLRKSRIQKLPQLSSANDLLNINFPQERQNFLDSRSSP